MSVVINGTTGITTPDVDTTDLTLTGAFNGVDATLTGDLTAVDATLSGGVIFSDAGGSGTSTSNTLDSYEEGTWTPEFASIATPTYSTQSGSYTKVGNMVTLTCHISVSSIDNSDPSGVSVSNFPFVAIDTDFAPLASLGRYTSLLSDRDDNVENYRLTSSAILLLEGDNDNIQYANCASSGALTLAFSYRTSS